MTKPVRIGVQLVQGGAGVTYRRLRDKVLEIEDAGTDVLFCYDHFNVPVGSIDAEKGIYAHGEQPDVENFEAWSVLSAWAEQTERIELGVLVSGMGYRNPDLLADMARTVDHISGGRLILGVGAGWYEKDYERYGFEFGTVGSRMKAFADGLDRIEHRLSVLKPAPQRKIPILIGGGGEKKTLPLVARYADIWHYFDNLDTLAHKNKILRENTDALGRDHREIERSQEWAGLDLADAYADAGVTLFTLVLWSPHDLTELHKALAWRDERNKRAAA
ncbi:LLM class F420-dependent oxidoreductase [Amycolatopsis rhabdoformis]|uniref:LLM class F420-dependent oxidoreductase n=1 Tax=Amycolatopsis rhabdoformis TaxID=1448059 RepID=A0ABZ1I757_9PSEU|nr:LLM class F420-dependent oxidoreductase [Amycolatopsis rhabdoformis]WSE29657.1 LLM class F420-dependent oxidoreductase [Amycolatopsis rhabdoformis]